MLRGVMCAELIIIPNAARVIDLPPNSRPIFSGHLSYNPTIRQGRPVRLRCNLMCSRCGTQTRSGARCRLRTCRHFPYCWIHMLHNRNLIVAQSRIIGAGDGLYAVDPTELRRLGKHPNKIPKFSNNVRVFPRRHMVVLFAGEMLSPAELEYRYPGDNVGLYATAGMGDDVYDELCARSISGWVNHASERYTNCSPRMFRNRPALYTKRDIYHGEELLWNYGEDYRTSINLPPAFVRHGGVTRS